MPSWQFTDLQVTWNIEKGGWELRAGMAPIPRITPKPSLKG